MLASLFENYFSNLPLTRITSSPSNNGSKREILLLLSSNLFKSLEFSTDFNHWSSSLKLCCITIFIKLVFASCSKLVLRRVAHFTFLMMLCWLILNKRISLNLITSATTLTILDQSDIRFFRTVKTSTSFVTYNKFFFQFRIPFVDWRFYFVVIPSCLWFPKKLWSKIQAFNSIIIININPSWCIICWVLFWTDIMSLGLIRTVFDEFSSVCQKYLEPFWFIPYVSQNKFTISLEYFFIDWNFQFFLQ